MATDWRWKDQLGIGRTTLDRAAEPLTLLAAGKEVLSITAEGVLEAAQFRGDGAHLKIAGKALQAHLQGKLDVTTEGVISGPLQVRGTLTTALPGPVDIIVDNLAKVVGRSADKIAATLHVGDAVKINQQTYTVKAIDPDQSAFTLNKELADGEPRTGLSVYTDTDLWVVQNGAGEAKLVVDKSGHVTAASFAGAIDAQHIRGTLTVDRLPNLPASKITGVLDVARIPTLTVTHLPDLPVSKITGLQAALDGKVSTTGGTITDALSFGTTRRQMINLWDTTLGIGIQDSTQYFRTGKNFAWYKGGGHTNGELTPGNGGTVQMVIKDGNVGIGTNDPGTDKLKVQGNTAIGGNLQVSGKVFARDGLVFYWGPDNSWKVLDNRAGNLAGTGNTAAPSDVRLKTAVRPVRNALEKVMQLQGTVYRWGEPGLKYFTRNITSMFSAGPDATEEENQRLWAAKRQEIYDTLAGEKIGLIAQEVETIVPEVILEDEEGYKHIQYQQLTALLVEAIKEQNELIRGLSVKVAALEAV